ncbi:MAG: hypothetical protein IT168_21655 [Bryobacterales bacterium]|nr:hypothetical protein [Bryobacterales bacterium]
MIKKLWNLLFLGQEQNLITLSPPPSVVAKPTPPTTLLEGGYSAEGYWKTAYISTTGGAIIKFEDSGSSEVHDKEWVQVDLLVEYDTAGYPRFTQCQIFDPASAKPCELSDIQKHSIVKYLSESCNSELLWQRAPESLKNRFAYSKEPHLCDDQHDWDGCICRCCGTTRSHEWGPIKEHDFSGLNVFDSRGTIKRIFAKVCVHCKKEEQVRTEYE